MTLDRARSVLDIEAKAIESLSRSLDENFEQVVELIKNAKGRIILTGMGKSGIICRKIAATLASTGTPAFFMHPAEAIHGDLGMVVEGDLAIAVSNSGETQELVQLLEHIKRNGARLVAITGAPFSTLAQHADAALIFTIEREGCPLNLAPMASTTTTLALGDALAAAVMDAKGFTRRDFARYHPGGNLGTRLQTVADVIKEHAGKPLVTANTTLGDTLIEISEKRFGMTAVALPTGLGLITDGDIRRLLQHHGSKALDMKAGDVCNRIPKTISDDKLAAEALRLLEEHKITSIIVLGAQDQYQGVIHLHDLWRTQMV